MTYKVYIQSLSGWPIADWALYAYQGFKERGTDIVFFENIEEVPASKWHIVVADIGTTNKYFERIGIGPKMSLNIPEEIEKYAGRNIERLSMGDFRKQLSHTLRWGDEILTPDNLYPIFIKPNGRSKEFLGGVVTDKEMFHRHFDRINDETPILKSEVVDFVSEYRAYCVDGKMIGLYWYHGDFRVFPDVKIIDKCISDYKSIPAGCSVDFGITSNGETLLVECNDGWSLGNYGLEPSLYCRLLGRRWHELTKAY